MENLKDVINMPQMAEIGDNPPTAMWLSDAASITNGNLHIPDYVYNYKRSAATRFTTGVIEGVEAIGDVPEQIQIIGGQTLIALGGYFEEAEMVKRGQMNISTAQKNLDATMAKRYDFASPEELESFAYTLGSGAVNYGTMILGGGLGATAKALGAGVKTASTLSSIGSLGTMGAMEAGQEAYERTSKYVTDTGDKTFSEYTPEKANKNLLAEAAYTAGSVALEHMVGFGAQKKIWKLDLNKTKLPSAFKRATIDTVRSGAMTAASETTTEALQSLLNIGIDLADGTMNMAEVPERLQQEMVGWAAASVIGGTAGISAAISHRANGLKYIKQQISDVVPPEDLNSVANTIFDTGANAVADRVSVELELSSELQNKHGAVYDSMQRAIKRAADESGAFKNYTEDEMAEYVSDTSKLFADQVLAEANQRNVNIDDVLKASDIVYEDGGIKLKNKDGEIIGQEVFQQSSGGEFKRPDYQEIEASEHYAEVRQAADNVLQMIEPDVKFADKIMSINRNGQVSSYVRGQTKAGNPFTIRISDHSTVHDYNDISVSFWTDIADIRNTWANLLDAPRQAAEKIRQQDQSAKEYIARNLPPEYISYYWQNGLKALKKAVNEGELPPFYFTFNKEQQKIYGRLGISWKDVENFIKETSEEAYYQGKIANRTKSLFKPILADVKKFTETLKKAIRGELQRYTMLQVTSTTPEVYKALGIADKPLNLPQNVLKKINIGKHNVSLSVIEKLPELVSNPLFILDSKTENGSFVSVLDAADESGNTVVAIIKPTDKAFNVIPSVYGKKEIENLIKSSNIRYVNDIEIPATASIDLASLQLRGGDSARGNNVNILQKSDIVNIFNQNMPNPKGSYNPSTGVIKIFETADFSTLPHELAHYWLDNMWNYTRSGNASEQYQQRWNVIANWLNVRPEQTRLTRGQQEKFARGYEQYLLNGDLPTPMIRGAFDDYDRWLKRVYNDINRLNVRLTDDAIRFFQSMTTGKLPAPKLKPMRKKRGKMTLAEKMRERMNIQQQEKQEQEAVNFMNDVEAARPMPDNIVERTVIKSNITEGRTGESRVYNREIEKNIDALSEIAEDNLEYNKVVLAEQAQKANEFVKNNLDEARKIVDGLRPAPENILDTAIRIAYEQEMLRIGDNAEYLRALKLHSSLQTLRGQEISAERISSADITAPEYWINKVIANRTHKVAKRIFGGWKSVGESSLELYKNMIKEETNAITKKVLAEKDVQAQKKVLNEEIKRLKYEYGLDNGQLELFQMPNDQPLNAKNAKMYVNNALDNLFGTTLTQEEADQIIGKVAELEKSISTTLDETGNPSIQTWIKVKEMNNLIESYTPSPALQIATSIVGRGVMLASLKSPTLNIISNTENILAEMIIRRAVNTVEGSATQSAVDRNVVSDYLKYANDVYRYSGYNVSTTQDIDASIVTLGEQRISTQGKGWYRKFARSVETGVFKYLMGYPDSVSKDIVFSDVASLEATTIALNEGKEGAALTKRANELFVDATRVEPTTEEGLLIRDKAIKEANIATYTNDTALSKLALGIRESLNKATGDVRLGDQLMPFVKTPANVVSLGLEYTAGLAYALPKLPKIIRDVKAGKITDESRTAIKAAMRNGLGVVLAMLLSSAFDPEDYTPEYDALSPSERRLALEKGAVFNSVRIGDKYISLDYLGPLALPMAAILTSRYREDNPLWGFTAGALSQAAKTPGVGEIYDAIKFIGDSVRRDAKENVENIGNIMLDYVRARTIPSIVNDLAKVFDDVERETSGGTFDKVQNSLPGFRNLLPEKYQTTSPTPRKTESPFSTLFFGARVKTASNNRVIYEIDRLYKNGNRVTITDVTRSGKLADLSEEKQQKARKEFAKRYYDAAYKLVSSRSYRQKDDEQKAYALNKARRKIIEDLKKELIK